MAARAEIASSPAPAAVTPGAALPLRSGVRLRALVLIRWAAVAGQLFTAAVVHWGLGFTLPVLAVGGAIALSALLNLTVRGGRAAAGRNAEGGGPGEQEKKKIMISTNINIL